MIYVLYFKTKNIDICILIILLGEFLSKTGIVTEQAPPM